MIDWVKVSIQEGWLLVVYKMMEPGSLIGLSDRSFRLFFSANAKINRRRLGCAWRPCGTRGWKWCKWPDWWTSWRSLTTSLNGRRHHPADSRVRISCKWRRECCTWRTGPNRSGRHLHRPPDNQELFDLWHLTKRGNNQKEFTENDGKSFGGFSFFFGRWFFTFLSAGLVDFVNSKSGTGCLVLFTFLVGAVASSPAIASVTTMAGITASAGRRFGCWVDSAATSASTAPTSFSFTCLFRFFFTVPIFMLSFNQNSTLDTLQVK